MSIHYEDDSVVLHHGDCLEIMRTLPDASVDAVVTDPPYGLGFMGREWDSLPPGEPWARECLRVLKPGGHLLAFGGMRTQHRLACAIEDAGFEIRDAITWLYSTGFPKSHNVTAALDRIVPADARCACGPRSTQTAEGSPVGYPSSHGFDGGQPRPDAAVGQSPAPSLADAPARNRDGRPRDGQVEALASSGPGVESGHPSTVGSPHRSGRPAGESPSSAGAQSDTETSTSAAPGQAPRRTTDRTQRTSGLAAGSASSSSWRNKHMSCTECGGFDAPQGLGTALKPATEIIVVARKPLAGTVAANVLEHGTGALNIDGCRVEGEVPQVIQGGRKINGGRYNDSGDGEVRHTLSQPHAAGRWPTNVLLDDTQAAVLDEMSGVIVDRNGGKGGWREEYVGAAARSDVDTPTYRGEGGASRFFPTFRYEAKAPASERPKVNGTAHPTVKPLDLMRWLVRLVTPPGGTVLEPFAGSGTTVEACVVEGFHCVAIEKTDEYLPLITQRINRQRNPVAYMHAAGDDLGLFDFGTETT